MPLIRNREDMLARYPGGKVVIEGKTKTIFTLEGTDLVASIAKDDITAGDGAKHDIIPEKGVLATKTTCNVFSLLKSCGVPVAFVQQDGPNSFIAPRCTMLPYEVVVRREGHGSYLKRNPHLSKGQLFPRLIVEFYLKTSGKTWKGKPLVADDPFMRYVVDGCMIELYDPAKPLHTQQPFLVLQASEVFGYEEEWMLFPKMKETARRTFLVLEKAWQLLGRTLVDFKIEFGLDANGKLMLADVIDNDSWRLLENGAYLDKQVYRDGGALSDVAARYAHVAALTYHFSLPHQRIVLWRGSETDDAEQFRKALGDFADLLLVVTCSAHKEPIRAVQMLHRVLQEVPDSVVIAYIGMSNGAGPTLSAQTTVPTITVPANYKEFREDVWSSTRTPSNVPVMTVLDPKNATQAALNILAARNPRIYAYRRADIESRATNVVTI
jgi:phosphoribosylaminoimidazole carboxylase/phosphoribosylaminoimidazole-succinocarboxamide synthase